MKEYEGGLSGNATMFSEHSGWLGKDTSWRYIICSRLALERKKNQNATSLKHCIAADEIKLLGDNKDV